MMRLNDIAVITDGDVNIFHFQRRVLDGADVVTWLHRNSRNRVLSRLWPRWNSRARGAIPAHTIPMFLDLAVVHTHDVVGEIGVWSARARIIVGMLPGHDDVIALRKGKRRDRKLPLNWPWMRFAIGGHELLQAARDLGIVLDKSIGHVLRRQVRVTERHDLAIPVENHLLVFRFLLRIL